MIGTLVAGALSLGAEAAKTAVGEVVKDAYKALKSKLRLSAAASDLDELEKAPHSEARKAVVAEAVDKLPTELQETLRALAEALTSKLKEIAPQVGLDIGRLAALNVELGKITVTEGIGVRIAEAHVAGTVKTRDISVGKQ